MMFNEHLDLVDPWPHCLINETDARVRVRVRVLLSGTKCMLF